jgi:hypothetical protein
MKERNNQPDLKEERQDARRDLALLLLTVMGEEASASEKIATVESICQNLAFPDEQRQTPRA